MISTGEKLPDATLTQMGAEGPEQVQMAEKVKGRKVATTLKQALVVPGS